MNNKNFLDARSLCFVLMPFGKKPDPHGGPPIDFDAIYSEALRPAIEDAGLQPIRADAESTGGIIHKAMFERLILCEYAVADLTTASANVLYELGVRHALRERTTLPIFAEGHAPPFDLNLVRCLPYKLSPNNELHSSETVALRKLVGDRLEVLKAENDAGSKDSPVFQLLTTLQPPDIDRLKTDAFRKQLDYRESARKALEDARSKGSIESLERFEESLGKNMADEELGVLADLFLSYRALSAWSDMLRLYEDDESFPPILRQTRMIQEQLGFALNRLGHRDRAVAVLMKVITDYGNSSETNGLLGRIFKDQWIDATKAKNRREARGHLRSAIKAYQEGFLVDPRDSYPGINAVTLLEIEGSEESQREKKRLLPVVRYAVERRIQTSKNIDYWDHATLLELSVLERNQSAATRHIDDALAVVRETWEPKTTANNLRMIQDARPEADEDGIWLAEIIEDLTARAEAPH